MPANESEEFEFRLRAEQESQNDTGSTTPQDPEDNQHDSSEYEAPKKSAPTKPVKPAKPESRIQHLNSLYEQTKQEARAPAIPLGEAALSMASGLGASIYGGLKGAATAVGTGAGALASGKSFGSAMEEGAQAGSDVIGEAQKDYTYQPRTAGGKLLTEGVAAPMEMGSSVLGKAGGAVGGAIGGEKGRVAGESIGEAALPMATTLMGGGAVLSKAKSAGAASRAADLVKSEKDTASKSIGAAETTKEAMRREQAAQLDVPTTLTKGQAERSFDRLKFESDTSKLPEGAPIRELHSAQNENILRNFDSWIDKTGAESPDLRTTGKIVDKVLVDKAKKAKAKINDAYDKARDAGETEAQVPYTKVLDYIGSHRPTVLSSNPVLRMVQEEIAHNDPEGLGTISLNAMEDIRQRINAETEYGTPNGRHGAILKDRIDGITEGAGGELYKTARNERRKYAKEFENVGVIEKLLRTKPGFDDRAVALEDIHTHSILNGSLDDVKAVRRTLQTAGDEGKQAWKELQGATINHLKELVTSNVSSDIHGNKIVSPAKLDKAIQVLDKDGKLDYLFGKSGADKIRNLNEHAKTVLTSPPGTVNSSNTASALIRLFDSMSGLIGGVPGAGHAVKYAAGKLRSRDLSKKVQESLSQPEDVNQIPSESDIKYPKYGMKDSKPLEIDIVTGKSK